ncbi:glutamine synthetase [candidate division KSB1 bacterium]|nr:MAG: glutamine synthetase [candidate division KSB1 bacterium]
MKSVKKQTPKKSATPKPKRVARDVFAALPASRLVRLIGKPSEDWTVDDLISLVREQKIRIVSLMHVGGDGWLKTLDFVPQDAAHLRDILSAGERADGSSIFAGLGIPVGASDIVLRPRPQTAFLDPFSHEPALVVLCGHLNRDGAPLTESPDTVVRAAYNRLKKETGVDLHALGEVEYFLGAPPANHSNYGRNDRGYHAASPFVFGETLRRQALVLLAEMGIPVKYGHSECGYIPADEKDPLVWEQHEIELLLQPLPKAAESVVLVEWVLRNLAHLHGMVCSFDPVVKQGHAGSGMHYHLSPVVRGVHQSQNGTNGELRDVSKWLIGGLVCYGGALMAFGNRDATSFLRLKQGKEAPQTVTWGRYNRKALVRLPITPRDEKGRAVSPETIEFRLPDGSAHPYFLLAGIAQAMVAGKSLPDLEDWLKKTSVDAAAASAKNTVAVPKSFTDIADRLVKNRAVFEAGGVFCSRQLDSIVEAISRQ